MKDRVDVGPRTTSGIRAAVEAPPSSRAPRRRRQDRIAIERTARMLVAGDVAEGLCKNLSLGGMAIESELRPPVGTAVRVWLTLEGNTEIYFSGIVRWVARGQIGVQHQLLGARDTYLLTEFLARHKG